ncbi:MAG: hypothetical protein AB1324_00730 [Candidatus Micrarchaeota archaeon]
MLQKLIRVFSEKENALRAAAYGAGLFILFSLPTALITNPVIPYIRMMPATPLDYAFLLTTSVLGGIYLAIPAASCAMDNAAGGGALLGFLSFGCPTCNQLLVLMLGYPLLLGIFDPLRPVIGVLSVAMLAYAINKKIGVQEWVGD